MSTQEAIVAAAFDLFARRGYEATSVEDIAAAAGVSRSTFFRLYGTKEAVIFPDHDRLLQQVETRLEASTADSAIRAVADAVRIVFFHYIGEGQRARERYRLTSAVPALHDRELVSGARYQRLFRRFISSWGDGSPAAELRAELMAAAVVAAHNQALRRWLRGDVEDPDLEIETALAAVHALFEGPVPSGAAVMVVLREGVTIETALGAVQGLAQPQRRGRRVR